MTPRTALAEAFGPIQADSILAIIKQSGCVIVGKDAIRIAQREAVAQWREDFGKSRYDIKDAV